MNEFITEVFRELESELRMSLEVLKAEKFSGLMSGTYKELISEITLLQCHLSNLLGQEAYDSFMVSNPELTPELVAEAYGFSVETYMLLPPRSKFEILFNYLLKKKKN